MIPTIDKSTRTYSGIVYDLIRLFVKHQSDLHIEESFAGTIRNTGQSLICVTVTTHVDDRAQVLGRGGARARAINELISLVSERRNERVNLTVINDKTIGRKDEPILNVPWDKDDAVQSVLENLMSELTDTPYFVNVDRSNDRTNIFLKVASRSVIADTTLRTLQQLVKGYGLVQGWKIYLTLQFLNEGQ